MKTDLSISPAERAKRLAQSAHSKALHKAKLPARLAAKAARRAARPQPDLPKQISSHIWFWGTTGSGNLIPHSDKLPWMD